MELYLVRHGIAEEVSASGTDADRRLTSEGIHKVEKVAKGFAKKIEGLDIILHSTFLRARETAEIFRQHYPGAKFQEVKGITPMDAPSKALALVEMHANLDRVMIVGHEPHLSGLAALLLNGTDERILEFKRAGIAAIDWGGKGASQLLFFLPPRMW